jgi:hypothetical protein
VAGPGAPLVAEFSIAEFAASIGLPTEAGKRYVGHAVELRYRLPRLWKRVVRADLQAWRARRVAEETRMLSKEAAAFVDRHVAPVAHKVRPAQLDRLVEEAIARFMPDEAKARREQAADGRHFTVDHHDLSFTGTSTVTGQLDLADALDLAQAVGAEAQRQADLGNPEPLDARRATAIGVIARRHLGLHTLDYPDTHPDAPTGSHAGLDAGLDAGADPRADAGADPRADSGAEVATPSKALVPAPSRVPARETRPLRTVVLHVHLSEAAIRGLPGGEIGRVENTRTPLTADAIREWCGNPDAQIVVKPVIDLAEHVSVEAYEVADRIAESVALRDISCVFPWCTRPARRLRPDEHASDCDHIVPHDQGGATCTCQIAPLCRRHHRLKTHGGWRYHLLEPGSYVWTSPHGYHYLRDHTGTLDISHDKHHCHPPPRADESADQPQDPPPDPAPGDT